MDSTHRDDSKDRLGIVLRRTNFAEWNGILCLEELRRCVCVFGQVLDAHALGSSQSSTGNVPTLKLTEGKYPGLIQFTRTPNPRRANSVESIRDR